MARYAASNRLGGTKQALTTTAKTLLALAADDGTALRRMSIYDIMFGTDGTPADQAMTYDAVRITAMGTATSVTPNKLDPADSAFLGAAGANHTAEPTVASNSNLIDEGINQRATMRWVAFPGGELIIPAVDGNGIAFRALSPGYTGTAICNVHFVEH